MHVHEKGIPIVCTVLATLAYKSMELPHESASADCCSRTLGRPEESSRKPSSMPCHIRATTTTGWGRHICIVNDFLDLFVYAFKHWQWLFGKRVWTVHCKAARLAVRIKITYVGERLAHYAGAVLDGDVEDL